MEEDGVPTIVVADLSTRHRSPRQKQANGWRESGDQQLSESACPSNVRGRGKVLMFKPHDSSNLPAASQVLRDSAQHPYIGGPNERSSQGRSRRVSDEAGGYSLCLDELF